MKLALLTLRKAASFRNQADLLYRVAANQGYEVDYLSLEDIVGPPKGHWDKLLALIPLWPRYIYEMVRMTAPWMSRSHVIYGPVDGPYQTNINLFGIMNNMRIVVPSQWCADMMSRNEIKVKAVVPHGIDHNDFNFSDEARYTRFALLRKQHPNKTIFFSNINPIHRKGLPHLAKAIEILSRRQPNKFVFILHTAKTQALKLEPNLLKTPNLLVEDAYNRLPFRAIAEKTVSCDVFVHPSLLEGFGLPILEAAAAKRAIVCLDSPPMTEIVGCKEAWLYPYTEIREEQWDNGSIAQLHEYDPEALAYAMEWAMTEKDESQAKAEAAYKRSLAFDFMKVYTPLVKM